MSYLGMKQLLEAGVHFGHETKRWNPKMKRYIFAERNGIFIIDLQKTLVESEKSLEFLKNVAAGGGTILFVGTKKQAQEILAAEAKRCGMPFINERWLGGLLTNFTTMKTRVERLKSLEKMFEDQSILRYTKKEQIDLGKEMQRLQRYLGGIKNLNKMPDAIYIVDPTKEAIAVKEANKLDIPVVALADTDSDPDVLDYIIPGNDDAIRSIQLVTARLSDLIVEVRGGAEIAPTAEGEVPAASGDETLAMPLSSSEQTIAQAAKRAGATGSELEEVDQVKDEPKAAASETPATEAETKTPEAKADAKPEEAPTETKAEASEPAEADTVEAELSDSDTDTSKDA